MPAGGGAFRGCSFPNLMVGLENYFLELGVYLVLVPVELLNILTPFEIGNDDAASVLQDVGKDRGAVSIQSDVGFGGDEVVGCCQD